jgi:general stress protein YciG
MSINKSPDESAGRFESSQTGYSQTDNTIGGQGQGGLLNNNASIQQKRGGRGFASMDPARVSQIASMGGRAAHEQGVAHEWTPEEARAAGRKGGQASHGGSRNGEIDQTGLLQDNNE